MSSVFAQTLYFQALHRQAGLAPPPRGDRLISSKGRHGALRPDSDPASRPKVDGLAAEFPEKLVPDVADIRPERLPQHTAERPSGGCPTPAFTIRPAAGCCRCPQPTPGPSGGSTGHCQRLGRPRAPPGPQAAQARHLVAGCGTAPAWQPLLLLPGTECVAGGLNRAEDGPLSCSRTPRAGKCGSQG